MNRNIYKYLYAVLLLMLALLPTGCANDDDRQWQYPEPDYGTASYVTFRVVTSHITEKRTTTRDVPQVDNAEKWEDDYLSEAGVEFDNIVKGNQFNVFITDNDGNQLTKLQNLIYIETSNTENNMAYTFSGEIPKDDVEKLKKYGQAKIHIVTNSGSKDLTDDWSFRTFSHAGQPSASFTAIPMWGVQSYDFTTLHPGQNDAGEIWLLRAMAKVEIMIDTQEKDNLITALTSASVTNANTQGYVLPKAWKQVTDTQSLSFENSLYDLSSSGSISNMTPTDGKIVFYLPETANSEGETEITLNYTTSLPQGARSDVIKFAKYEEGIQTATHYDIVRNHLYRFKVSFNRVLIEFKYTVCPWKEYTIEIPEFD